MNLIKYEKKIDKNMSKDIQKEDKSRYFSPSATSLWSIHYTLRYIRKGKERNSFGCFNITVG